MADRIPSNRSRLGVEGLEDRTTPAQFGNPWPDPLHLTLSFAGDGTTALGVPSNLHRQLGRALTPEVWQKAVLRAVQAWSQAANLNIGLVGDGGQPFGTAGPAQGDPRFGDIRVGGLAMAGDALAATVPPDPFVSGTLAGDLFVNTRTRFTFQSLYGVALHEVGHALGLAPSTDPASVMFNTINRTLALAASDVAAVRALYGNRAADANEGSNGNQTIDRATRVKEPGSYDGETPLVAFGDITTRTDVDVYEVRNQGDNSGPITFRLQTSGISLLAARMTVTDENGRVLATATGDGIRGGVLTVTLPRSVPGEDYFVHVRSAPGTQFGVGRYGLGVTFNALAEPTATPLATVLRGPFDALDADEIEALFADPDALYGDDGGTDETPGEAGDLPEVPGFAPGTRFGITASLATLTDVDHYTFRAPHTAAGTAVLTATTRAVGPNGGTPRIEVFDVNLNPVPVTILANGNGTFTVQAVGVAENEDYVVRVGDPDRSGNYALDVSFVARVAQVQTFNTGTLNTGEQLGSTLYVGRSQVFGLALEATGPAGAAVQLSVVNAAGQTVFTLTGRAGDTVTGQTALLAPGEYTLRLTVTGPAGAVGFALKGGVISDPIGPRPSKATAAPQYKDPAQPGSFLYPGGTSTTDPYLWLSWLRL